MTTSESTGRPCGLRFTDTGGRDVVVTPDGGRFVLGREEGAYWAVPPGLS